MHLALQALLAMRGRRRALIKLALPLVWKESPVDSSIQEIFKHRIGAFTLDKVKGGRLTICSAVRLSPLRETGLPDSRDFP